MAAEDFFDSDPGLEPRIMLEETLARYPNMRLAGTPAYVKAPFINQLKTLPVRLQS